MPLDYFLDFEQPKKGAPADPELLRAVAAIDALRADPRQRAMVDDSTTKVVLGPGVAEGDFGKYNRGQDMAYVDSGQTVDNTRGTIYHELLHGLQQQGALSGVDSAYNGAYRNNPLAVLDDRARGFHNSDKKVGAGETPRAFSEALDKSNMNYGEREAAAFLATHANNPDLPPKRKDLQKLVSEFPILSTMYGQMNAQPNRPLPQHYKHEAEWTTAEKLLNKTTGIIPTIDLEQRTNAAGELAAIRALRELNPRSRR